VAVAVEVLKLVLEVVVVVSNNQQRTPLPLQQVTQLL
jgi:hypothetical protein